MKPKPQPADSFQLFQAQFSQILNREHPLVRLSDQIDWQKFDLAFEGSYRADLGAPAKAMRLMAGMHYLKYAFNESDESLVERWLENPYWQYFCGFTHMQHEAPLDPSSLSRWRKRVGPQQLELLLKETIDLAQRAKHLRPQDLTQLNIDTTDQEKNITHPTDSKLLHTAIRKLVAAARGQGVQLRQSYERVSKKAAMMAGRYAHARQFGRMRRELRRLRTWVGGVIRDITRKVAQPSADLQVVLQGAERIRSQQQKDSPKIYSWHEPEVQCISKGKARQRYEFGQKVALATTNRSNWIVAARLMPNNPYDGHTLAATLSAAKSITGRDVADAYVDKGYRGHGCSESTRVHVAGAKSKRATRAERRRCRRRSAIEPKIGHLKSDHRVDRCFLTKLTGDAINIVLAAAGSNLRKLLRRLVFALRDWLKFAPSAQPTAPLRISAAA